MANKVLIIGDAMVDTYIYGEVERVSPEAPVPVITPSRTKQYLGGAGNVARNAAALGAKVSVFFTVGKARDGSILEQKLHEWNINCEYLFRDDSIDTINKTRVIGNNQQIVIAVNVVHKSIFPVNSSAPSLAVFKRLGFADTLRQTVSFNVLNKGVYFFQSFAVEHLPLQIFFPCNVRPDFIHRQPQ